MSESEDDDYYFEPESVAPYDGDAYDPDAPPEPVVSSYREPATLEQITITSDGLPDLPVPEAMYYLKRSADTGAFVDTRSLDDNDMLVAGVFPASPVDGCVLTNDWREITPDRFDAVLRQQSPNSESGDKPQDPLHLPEIFVEPNIERMASKVTEILGTQRDSRIYQRNGMLVDVVHDAILTSRGFKPEGRARIRELPEARLREIVSSGVHFKKRSAPEGNPKTVACPTEVIYAIMKRGQWEHIKLLNGVVNWPSLRSDGSAVAGYGYDRATHLLCESRYDVPLKSVKTRDDALLSLKVLKDLVCDFPFVTEAHRSAWIAFLITMMCRHAIPGPCPLILIDATTMGSGKSLLADIVWNIVDGQNAPRSAIPGAEDEWNKTLVSIGISAEPLILFDNLSRKLKSDAFEAVLTGTSFGGRLLSTNTNARFTTPTVFCITANNAQISADLVRRSIHIRIAPKEQNPELRQKFKHSLPEQALKHRSTYQDAALSVVRAYCSAGRPKPPSGTPRMGSFEGWSDLVRNALLWAGEPDPLATQRGLRDASDSDTEELSMLLESWQAFYGEQEVCGADMLADIEIGDRHPMRFAVLAYAGQKGRLPSARELGARLKSARGRTVDGMYLEWVRKSKTGAIWKLIQSGRSE